jgi:carbon-monoxide dehydrogenase medium subunit
LQASGSKAKVLGGGTDLLIALRTKRLTASVVVDIKRIPGLAAITVRPDGGFTIGAAAACSAVAADPGLRAAWPGVAEAVSLIGSVQVRNRATLAGNLCNASPAADSVPALVTARAVAVLAGPSGERRLPVEQVTTGPGTTALAADEMLVAFELPPPPPRSGSAYLRLTPRTEMDIAVVGCGVSLELAADGSIAAARLALGAVAPTVLLVPEAATVLVGKRLDEATLGALAAAARAACRPITDMRGSKAYRIHGAGVLARRAAVLAYQRAEARQ